MPFTQKTELVTPILKELHWLLVVVRIGFKILVLVFKANHAKFVPLYISDVIAKYELTRSLCSSSKRLIIVPWYKLKTYERGALSVNDPMNCCSQHYIREIESLSTFKK